ncbi:hypothetical protein E4O92_18805 [Massilia horti]|uniref:Uncharacterized protein n=1 Tax=Massilia horti TaxID=2562153 RepID=A0A4Y9SSN1_9BURK|nr:hypothetical protein E4O92_18805 [Massilia horti]
MFGDVRSVGRLSRFGTRHV